MLYGLDMVDKAKSSKNLSLLLLQESLWKIEDKLNVFVEGLADHEADIIRLRRSLDKVSLRLKSLETLVQKPKRRFKNG